MTLEEAQKQVDNWIRTYGVRYFSELTNMAVLTEEVGELARVMARKYGDQSFKPGEKDNLDEEIADVFWVLLCIANQTGVDLTEAFRRSIEKKTKRDQDRHINNPKLKEHGKKEPTKSKYDEALAKYNTSLDDADVAAQVKAIIEQKVAANDTPEVKKCIPLPLHRPHYAEHYRQRRKCNALHSECESLRRRIPRYEERGCHLRLPQLRRNREGYTRSGRRKDSLCIGRISLLADLHRSEGGRNGDGRPWTEPTR